MVAADFGVAERGALLGPAVHLDDVESRSIVSGAAKLAGPAPAAHSRASSSRLIASSCRTLDHLCARSHDPTVDGARVPSNNDPAAPARRTATSSMLSPPTSIAPITVSAFAPLF